jgi:transposase
MDRYIGIDAHSESCTVAVMGASGKRIRQDVVDTHAKVLIDMLKKMSGNKYLCLEEGELTEWLVEILAPYVKEVWVVQPREHRGRKSDADDAWALAELIRVRGQGAYVFKPMAQYRALREAMRAYVVMVKEASRAKLRFRGLLRSRGIQKLDRTIYDPDHRSDWIKELPPAYRMRAELLGEAIDSTNEAFEKALCWLTTEGAKLPEVDRLKGVPGLGEVRAAQVVALVVTPHRFRKTRQFWSYAGLGIVTRASGEWKRQDGSWQHVQHNVQTRGLNRNRQPLLKAIFKGAAIAALRGKNHLRDHYERMIANGIDAHLARLTIARRIASATLTIWKKKEDYDPSKHHRSKEAA